MTGEFHQLLCAFNHSLDARFTMVQTLACQLSLPTARAIPEILDHITLYLLKDELLYYILHYIRKKIDYVNNYT